MRLRTTLTEGGESACKHCNSDSPAQEIHKLGALTLFPLQLLPNNLA